MGPAAGDERGPRGVVDEHLAQGGGQGDGVAGEREQRGPPSSPAAPRPSRRPPGSSRPSPRAGAGRTPRGNAYREETDFFVRVARSEERCVLTPRTFFWEAGRWPGGQARHALCAEWWTVRNKWRFLRRDAAWLEAAGHITSPAAEQAAFVARRIRRTSARARRARGAPRRP
jgi:hypothetical protein